MGNKKNPPKKEKKKYTFHFSTSSLFLLFVGMFIILGWVFSLGIMVGRGLLPDSLETLFSSRNKPEAKEEKKTYDQRKPINEEELSFYTQLVDKKVRAKKKISLPPPSNEHDKAAKRTNVKQKYKDTGDYSVQVAALKGREESEKMVKRLTRLGYQAYYYRTTINGTVNFRVRCGPFPTIHEAKKNATKLADKEGFQPFITTTNDE